MMINAFFLAPLIYMINESENTHIVQIDPVFCQSYNCT